MSVELTTAVAEYEQDIGIRPGTFCGYDVSATGILDLRRQAVLAANGIDPAVCLAPWKTTLLVERRRPSSWDVAERLIAAEVAGILVPSAQLVGGSNLVLWRWNDSLDRTVVALDPQHDLPRDQSSWPIAGRPPTL